MLSHSDVSTLCHPMACSPPGYSVHGDSPDKNTGVVCHALLQGIVPTQGLNPGLLHCRHILYQLSHQGSPNMPYVPHFSHSSLPNHLPGSAAQPILLKSSLDYVTFFPQHVLAPHSLQNEFVFHRLAANSSASAPIHFSDPLSHSVWCFLFLIF